MALIIILSLTPGDKLPIIDWELISISSLAHFGFYFGLSFLMLIGFMSRFQNVSEKKMNLLNVQMYLGVVLAGIIIGYSVELIQGNFIYRRYYDNEDVLVNTIGTIFGAVGYTLIGRKLV